MLSVKQGGIKYHFWVFGMTQPGIEPWSPRPLAGDWYSIPGQVIPKNVNCNKLIKTNRVLNTKYVEKILEHLLKKKKIAF